MRALVVGASGQVGGALVRALEAHGHTVTGTYHEHALPGLVELDTTDSQAVIQLIESVQPDWVFYPAGLSWVDFCEREPDRCFFENVQLPVQVADFAADRGAGFVYFSSEYVFDGRAGPYDETAEPNPLNVYGKSKLAAERQLADRIGRLIIVRTTVVYGPEIQKKNFVYQLMARAKGSQRMAVPHDQVSTPTFNRDLAAACVECAEWNITGVINLVGPDRIDRYAFALEVCRTFGLAPDMLIPMPTADLKQMAQRPLNAGLVNTCAQQVLHTALTGVVEGLNSMKANLAQDGNPCHAHNLSRAA
jgi:dTDP-4-dehydrorhamnose reductase